MNKKKEKGHGNYDRPCPHCDKKFSVKQDGVGHLSELWRGMYRRGR